MPTPYPAPLRSFTLALATSLLTLPSLGDPPASPQPIRGARMPALSPDGQRIVFVYRGDLWSAPATGGRALPITRHLELDAYPLFSPDGQSLAFASRRHGNWDLFLMAAEGGPARQLTWHASADLPSGWSPDGQSLLFTAKRDTADWTLYALDISSLQLKKLAEDYATMATPNWSPDGTWIVYGRFGFPWWRPRYHGSAAAQVWLLNPANGQRQPLTSNQAQHLWSRFLPSNRDVVTVTVAEPTPSTTLVDHTLPRLEDSPQRTPNLWRINLDGQTTPLTRFVGRGGVRSPSVATQTGDIAFEYDAKLWLLRAGQADPAELAFTAAADDKQNRQRKEKIVNGVTEAEPSPDGKQFAFGLRGDIWTVAVEKPTGVAARRAEFARRLTDWAGDDSDFVWSPDGKTLYFTSDREANTRLYQLDLANLEVKPLWNRPDDSIHPQLSPGGQHLAFWVTGPQGGLYVMSLTNHQAQRLVHLPGPHEYGSGGRDLAWSPDSRWIAFTRRGENQAWNLWLVPASGGEPANLTRLNALHSQPAWSPDGKFLFFQSNRDGDGIYALPLHAEPARPIDVDLTFEKPKEPVTIDIDWTHLTRRIRKISGQPPQSSLTVTAEGRLVFLSEGDVWSASYDGKETKRLTTGGGKAALRVSPDGKKAFFIQNGELMTLNLGGGNPTKISFTADWERDVTAERQAAFAQFWRTLDRGFYDGTFHGRDWAALRAQYEPLLESVDTPDEFATLLQMMIGELDCSHAEVRAATEDGAATTPHLGFTFDYSHPGPGLRVASVPHGAPGSYPQTQILPGDFILAINGRDVSLNEQLYQLVNDRPNRDLEFTVNTHTNREGARTVRYQALSQDEWNDLLYRNRVERLRRRVEDRSHGRIGYVHLAGMGGQNQAQFEREAYEYILGKDAMILDVRFNGGGNISDTLIDWLERKPHGFYRPRDGQKEDAPTRAWTKPIVVLMHEHSFSNAEMFPAAMKAKRLARLVGKPTPGYVIWTTNFRLVDGTSARLPLRGVFRLDGSPMENRGETPDVEVWLSPDDWLADRDPQLDKALELLTQ